MNLKHLQKTFTLQHDQSDCGVACLLSLINYYGGSSTLEKLRETSGTTKQGTTLLGLYQAANQTGFDAQGCQADIQSLIEHRKPAILHVLIENRLEHYIVCYGYKNKHFIVGDPGKGIIHLTTEELSAMWVTKKCLTLQPNQYFVKKEEVKSLKKQWIKRLIRDDYQLLGISIVLGVFISILSMALSVFTQKLIDNILPSHNMQKLVSGIVFLFFLLVFRGGLFAVRQYMLLRQSRDFNNRIVNVFYSSLLFLPKPFFDTRQTGELVARLNDTARIQRVISQIAGNFIIDVLIACVSLVFLFFYSLKSGIIACVGLPFYFLLVYRFNSPIICAQKNVMAGYAQSESNYISTIQGVNIIKNANKQHFFSRLNKVIYGLFQDKVFALGKINVKLTLLTSISGVVFLTTILTTTAIDVFNNKLQIGELMAIIGIASSLLPSVNNLALIWIPVNEAKIAFNRMFEFASIKPENDEGELIDEFNTLTIKDLAFRYAGRVQLLCNVSLHIKKGEIIAIVGESGCGKSTLAQIIQKFYVIEKGQIIVNNKQELSNIKTNNWRNCIEIIPQDIHLFNGTVSDNICLSENTDVQHVAIFCNQIGIMPYIEKLPQGLLTVVGEEGVNLSGGQKQVLALARSLYRKPQLLIMDEATSALDRKTEQFILDLLKSLKNQLAVIFISHRIHNLPNFAHRIYVIENRTTSISGTHNQLMKSSNFYSLYWQQVIL